MSLVEGSAPAPFATIAGMPLNVHDHMCVLHQGAPQRDELLLDFLAEGVGAGHKCYCIIAPTEHEWMAAAVAERGHQAGGAQTDGAEDIGELEFTDPGGICAQAGGFASELMLTFWEDWGAETYERQHWAFARIGADMSWARSLIAPDFLDDLARYESRFILWSRRHSQVTVCMYDLDQFGGEVILPIMKVHPRIWMAGVVLENPYFLDSQYLLAEEREWLYRTRRPRDD